MTAVSPESGQPHRMSDHRDAVVGDCSLDADFQDTRIGSGSETKSKYQSRPCNCRHDIHGRKPRFLCIWTDARPCNCVTSQMTFDARGTRMTRTGPAYVCRLATGPFTKLSKVEVGSTKV